MTTLRAGRGPVGVRAQVKNHIPHVDSEHIMLSQFYETRGNSCSKCATATKNTVINSSRVSLLGGRGDEQTGCSIWRRESRPW